VTLDPRRVGDALFTSAADLARVWRAARSAARPGAFPGLLDGVIESYLATAGEALAAGSSPALVWPATTGVVRIDAKDPAREAAELDAEWDLVSEVFVAALRALDADDEAIAWAERAIGLARAGARSLRSGAPAGILVAHLHSGNKRRA
jgi:hypothetical protein